MEPDSAWLRELAATKIAIPVVAVWSVSDEFVAPQDSARWPGAREHILAAHDHMSMVFSDRVASIIGDAAVRPSRALEMNATQQLGEGDLIGGRHFGARLAPLRGGRIGEHAEAGVHDDLADVRRHSVKHLAENAELGGDPHRLTDDRTRR